MARILIVDDSFTARSIIGRLIGAEYSLSFAGNGAEALAAVRADRFDLVLLDLLMPVMDGFATLAEIRKIDPSLPVLIVSADIQDSTRRRVLEAGAVGVVNKPVNKDLLRERIEGLLGARR
jgi:CheY-like chemotaxis protein